MISSYVQESLKLLLKLTFWNFFHFIYIRRVLCVTVSFEHLFSLLLLLLLVRSESISVLPRGLIYWYFIMATEGRGGASWVRKGECGVEDGRFAGRGYRSWKKRVTESTTRCKTPISWKRSSRRDHSKHWPLVRPSTLWWRTCPSLWAVRNLHALEVRLPTYRTWRITACKIRSSAF